MKKNSPRSILDIAKLEKDFHAFLRQYDPMYKTEIIRINISSTFLQRARCKSCGSSPNYYYYVRKPGLWKSASQQVAYSSWFRSWIKRMSSDWYLESEPKYFHNIGEFNFSLEDKHHLPTFHNKRGVEANTKNDVIELLGCECGATIWAFNDKSTKKRPEITNRRGRYRYPQKFDY